jgi:hypothetical protein
VSVNGAGKLKVYRPPFLSLALAWVGAGLFFVVGLSMVTIGPSHRDGASSVVLGALALLLALSIGTVLATNRLTVTSAGLVYRNNLRRRVVSWAEVQSFGVGKSRNRMQWPTLVIRRNGGSLLVTNLASFTRTYPARVAAELTAWQRQLAPAGPGSSLDAPSVSWPPDSP